MTSDPDLLKRATQDIVQLYSFSDEYPFIPLWMFIVTWKNTTYYSPSGGSASTVSSGILVYSYALDSLYVDIVTSMSR